MKLLMICPLNTRGGGATTFWSLCRKFVDIGNEVKFIERILPGDKLKSYPNVRYYYTVDRYPLLSINILVSLLYNTLKVLFVKADIVYVMKPLPNSCIPALIKKVLGCKIVMFVDDLDYELYENGFMKRFMRFWYNHVPKYFDMLTFTSQRLMDRIKKDHQIPEERLYSMPNGAEFDRFKDIDRDNDLKTCMGIGKEKVVVYLASLGISTDFKLVVSAFKKIKMKDPNIKFLVIGGGSKLEYCKDLVKKEGLYRNAVFTGYIIDHDSVPQYINIGDVGINLMEDTIINHYRAPVKVNEYLATGLPVVVNDVGDYSMVKKYITVVKNGEDFADAVLKALESDSSELKSRRKEFIRNNLDWLSLVKDFNRVLKTMLANQPSKRI